nr:hypothetical protein [Tanacetum cinerariifolium]
MDMTIDQQVALDEALVPYASRLRIGKSNFRLKSDISSKESTLQLVYDVLRLTPFFKAFLVTADVPEIYMHEFWATVTVYHHSIRFKMDNKKHIFNLEYFREMLHICPRLPGHTFDELPFEEEILAFLRFLRHSGEIRRLTDVEHKDAKKINEMYYPRFTKVIIHYFMSKDPLISKRNKLTNKDIKNSKAYKEYYAVAIGATPPKTKASIQKTKSSSDTTVTPLTAAAAKRLSTSTKGKQPAKASKAKSLTQTHISQASGSGADEGTGSIPGVPDVPTEESDEKISWKSSDEEDDDDVDEGSDDQDDDDAQDDDDDQDKGDDDDDQEEGSDDKQDSDEEGEEFIYPCLSIHDEEETGDEESFNPITKMPEKTYDEDELYRDVNINLEGKLVQMADVHTTQEFEDSHVTLTLVNPDGQQQSSSVSSQFVTSMLNPTPDAGIDLIFETTSQMDVQFPTTVAPIPLSIATLTPSTISTISIVPQAPTPPTTALSTLLQDLPNFGSLFGFDHRLKTLEANFYEFVQMNQFTGASDRLRNEAQAENEEFLKNLDENIQKIIKEQVKEQVKILIKKMEGNKSIHRSNEQRNLYNALVKAYESDKIILDTYGDTVTLKRRRDDDADKDEEPSAGSDRGPKRRREGKKPESASAPKEKATRSTGKSTQGSKSQQTSTSESTTTEEPMQTTHKMEEPSHPEFKTGTPDDQPIAETSQHPEWFSQQKKHPTPDRD